MDYTLYISRSRSRSRSMNTSGAWSSLDNGLALSSPDTLSLTLRNLNEPCKQKCSPFMTKSRHFRVHLPPVICYVIWGFRVSIAMEMTFFNTLEKIYLTLLYNLILYFVTPSVLIRTRSWDVTSLSSIAQNRDSSIDVTLSVLIRTRS